MVGRSARGRREVRREARASLPARAIAIVVMGVSGAGKTTIGAVLARRLGAEFLEGDQFHPAANIAKMKRGAALDDEDRAPWLDRLGEEMARRTGAGMSVVLACSALKRAYRDRLRRRCPAARFVYLAGDKPLIRARLERRKGHFMPPALLDSQFADLEPPEADEDAIAVDISGDPEALIARILKSLGPAPGGAQG